MIREKHVNNIRYNLLESLNTEPYTKVKAVRGTKGKPCTDMSAPKSTNSDTCLLGFLLVGLQVQKASFH